MKFNYIIGNPPYQYPKGSASPMAKLYLDISQKIKQKVETNGSLSFVTPKGILYSNASKKLLKNLTVVDYSADNYFSVLILIIAWKIEPNKSGDIKVLMSNNKEKTTSKIQELSDWDEEELISITNKVNYKYNGMRRMCIRNSSSQSGSVDLNKCFVEQDKKNIYPVFCQRQKFLNNIGYTDRHQITQDRLVIPFGRPFRKGNLPKIRNTMVDQMFYVSLNNGTPQSNTLKNQESFLNSKLVTYCVNEYGLKVKATGFNEFLSRLPEIDFSQDYTNEDYYRLFNLTKNEIQTVDLWYQHWDINNKKGK